MDNQAPHRSLEGSMIDKDSQISTHIMLPLSLKEYQKVFGETPDGFLEDYSSEYVGLWVTKSDLRRGENRWRSLGQPDPMTHNDTLCVVKNLSEVVEKQQREYQELSDGLDDTCKRLLEAEARIETLETEKTKAEANMIEAQRSTAVHQSRVDAKIKTIEKLKDDKNELHRDVNAERLKLKAHHIAKRNRNVLQKVVAKIFMIS